MYPTDRRYSQEHEWVILEADGRALVGITDFASGELGDIVFLELPKIGSRLTQFQKLGEIESVKSVSEIYSPVSGEVVEVNQELLDHPEIINVDPFTRAWMVRLDSVDPSEIEKLLSAEAYDKYVDEIA